MGKDSYYVYVYIDPRNFEEFYYGKGKGSRKNDHLSDNSDNDKTRRIKSIREEGLEPIVRVVARNLSEYDALLIEKTLLWKLGKHLTNIATGHYVNKFRPHSSFHKMLTGFDFENGLYYYNVGECHVRNWDDYLKFGFISAGGEPRFREAMLGFETGDIIAAYLKEHGFVGIGRISQKAIPIKDVLVGKQPLLEENLKCPNMAENSFDLEKSEYVALVDWVCTVDRANAKWKPKSGLFTSQLVRASLSAQPGTMMFLEQEFSVDFKELMA